ncbi:UNVERIFIED_CONTAM: hypothetical protein HDU68_002219 [Siphonaria sp. JEL0065]|nr:hypothetical protein HDU68_002219 [Siphonaria sp. JEL0065]
MDIDLIQDTNAINQQTDNNNNNPQLLPTPTSVAFPGSLPFIADHSTTTLQQQKQIPQAGKLIIKVPIPTNVPKTNSFPTSPISPTKKHSHSLLLSRANAFSPQQQHCQSPNHQQHYQEYKSPRSVNPSLPEQPIVTTTITTDSRVDNQDDYPMDDATGITTATNDLSTTGPIIPTVSGLDSATADEFSLFKLALLQHHQQEHHFHPVAAESFNVPSTQTSSSDLLTSIPANAFYLHQQNSLDQVIGTNTNTANSQFLQLEPIHESAPPSQPLLSSSASLNGQQDFISPLLSSSLLQKHDSTTTLLSLSSTPPSLHSSLAFSSSTSPKQGPTTTTIVAQGFSQPFWAPPPQPQLKLQQPSTSFQQQQQHPHFPPKPKTHKKSTPIKSLSKQTPANIQTPYEREIEGIFALNVFATFRQHPASLLITMEHDEDEYASTRNGRFGRYGGRDGGCGGSDDDDMNQQNIIYRGEGLQLRSGSISGLGGNGGIGSGGMFGGSGGLRRVGSGSVYDSNSTLVNGGNGGGSGSRNRSSKRRNSELSNLSGGAMNERTGSYSGGESGSYFGGGGQDRMDSGSSFNSSPKRRRTSSPTKPLFSNWSNIGSNNASNGGNVASIRESSNAIGAMSRPKPVTPPVAKYVMPPGDGSNDKVRPLPFPLIDQELIDDYTQCKDPGDVVTWKKTPITFPEDMEGYSKLAVDEIETCSILRVPPADYLQVKNILLSARKHFDTFTKRQAQKWYGIDVNKTGKIFDWFVSKNWLAVSSKGKPPKK